MSIPAISHLTSIEFRKPITFFVGENGTGKSTLLEAIAVSFGFNPEGGSLDFMFNTKDSHSELHDYITIMRGLKRPRDGFFLRAESFYNVATYIEETEKYRTSGVEYITSHGRGGYIKFWWIWDWKAGLWRDWSVSNYKDVYWG